MNTQTVTLDVTKRRQVMPEIRIGQGDKDGTTLVANIYDNGEPFTLTNYTVRFAMRLPFDMAYYSVVGTVSGNTATFKIDESYAASVAGVTEVAYVEVLSGTTVICSTNRIRVVCLESAYENVDPAHLWDNGVEQFLEDAQDTLDAAVTQAQSDVSDAVDDADAATSRATQAAEAAEGVVLDAVPTMSPTLKGGAKLGSGLEVVSDTLSIDLTDEATGESVTATDASYLAGLTVDGKAVQDGTPTPSNPVPVEVVQGINLYNPATRTDGYWINDSGVINSAPNNSYSDKIAVSVGDAYTFSVTPIGDSFKRVIAYKSDNTFNGLLAKLNQTPNVRQSGTFTIPADTAYIRISINTNDIEPQLEAGSTATPYIPYGSIGLKVGSTITPIDLQGNVLASLPDGTKDVLTVDSVGHVVLEKRVGNVSNPTVTDYANTIGYFNLYDGRKNVLPDPNNPICYCDKLRNYQVSASNFMTYTNVVKCARMGSSNPTMQCAIRFDGTEASVADFNNTLSAIGGIELYYPLETAETIDFGYIDMPAIPDGSTISITAQVTPTISASWWARGAAAIAEALQAVRARLQAIEAAIAELATA